MLETDVTVKYAAGGRTGFLTGSDRRQWSGGAKEWKNTGKNQYTLRKRRWERYRIRGKRRDWSKREKNKKKRRRK